MKPVCPKLSFTSSVSDKIALVRRLCNDIPYGFFGLLPLSIDQHNLRQSVSITYLSIPMKNQCKTPKPEYMHALADMEGERELDVDFIDFKSKYDCESNYDLDEIPGEYLAVHNLRD